jgi:peptidoglycan/xylan/chitin deacetylase (PgdA/CDA1 family)
MDRDRWKRFSKRRAIVTVTLATSIAATAGCFPAPDPTNPSVRQAISRCWNPTPLVWLTFDDFGTQANVGGLIDVLVRNNVRARFFPVGTWAQANPWLIVRMAEAGQAISNHTYDHADFNNISDAQIGWEIDRGFSQSPSSGMLLRPPYGDGAFTQRINAIAAQHGYHVCYWTVDTRDWTGISASAIISAVQYGSAYTPPVFAGGVVLMHMSAPHTLEALQGVINAVRARGLQLVPIH